MLLRQIWIAALCWLTLAACNSTRPHADPDTGSTTWNGTTALSKRQAEMVFGFTPFSGITASIGTASFILSVYRWVTEKLMPTGPHNYVSVQIALNFPGSEDGSSPGLEGAEGELARIAILNEANEHIGCNDKEWAHDGQNMIYEPLPEMGKGQLHGSAAKERDRRFGQQGTYLGIQAGDNAVCVVDVGM
jgi:hypothetical protein